MCNDKRLLASLMLNADGVLCEDELLDALMENGCVQPEARALIDNALATGRASLETL